MTKIEIDSTELCNRIEHYLSCRDISDGKGGRTIPVTHNINYMAYELAMEISKSNEEYYESDDFRSLA